MKVKVTLLYFLVIPDISNIKSGLTRHVINKHNLNVSVSDHNEQETNGKKYLIHNWELRKLIWRVQLCLRSDYCFLEEQMNSAYWYQTLFEPVWSNFKSSPEKFYSQYFKLSMECLVFQNIPKQVSMLLFSELATLCLEYNMNGNKSTHRFWRLVTLQCLWNVYHESCL